MKMLQPRVAMANLQTAKTPPKTADRELLTAAHRVWRNEVIKRAKSECQDPDHRGDPRGHRLVADHILERQDRPDLALHLSNGRGTCWACHSRKSAAERTKRMRNPSHGGRQ